MLTSKQCLTKYGQPELEKFMLLWDVPTKLELGVIPKKIYCNKDLVVPLQAALTNVIERDLITQLKTWDGCFNIRKMKGKSIAGPRPKSLHAWGVAIDINAAWNGYGKTPTMSAELVKCFTDVGFDWGGTWTTPDGMHFQLRSI